MSSSTATPSGPTAASPLLIGDHPALDLLNSVLAPNGPTLDFLSDGASLCEWLAGSGVLPEAVVGATRHLTSPQLDRLASDVRTLREDLRRFLLQRSQGRAVAPSQADADFVNLWLSRSPLVQSLVADKQGWKLELRREPVSRVAVTAELAALCADLIANCPAEQVRKCENPACTLWFNDAKRGPRRRWCSMAICGNRMKVAAHRVRHRSDT